MTRPPTVALFLPSLESPEPDPPALCEQPPKGARESARARAISGPTSFVIWRGTIARRRGRQHASPCIQTMAAVGTRISVTGPRLPPTELIALRAGTF